jgi:regulatory protein
MAGTVTALSLQQKNKERVSVFLDGEYSFSLDLAAAASLRKGQHLTDDEITELGRADEEKRAYLSAIRMLGVRPRSTREVEQALGRKAFAPEAIQSAVRRLQSESLLDDAAFARYWAENRSEYRPRSAGAMRYELRQKGVNPADIAAALVDVDEEAAAWEAAVRKSSTWQRMGVEEAERKVYAYLARRGFSWETSRAVWSRLKTELGMN